MDVLQGAREREAEKQNPCRDDNSEAKEKDVSQ